LLLPSSDGLRGRKFQNSRLVVEGMLYRLRTGLPWRDLPAHFGPWKTVWKRHRRYAGDGTWDRVLIALAAMADAGGDLDWAVSVDSAARGRPPPGAGRLFGIVATGLVAGLVVALVFVFDVLLVVVLGFLVTAPLRLLLPAAHSLEAAEQILPRLQPGVERVDALTGRGHR
ncbi:transposase, partial [Rhodococcus sp. T2V]|uniref:transposase n=1 Tax=Rhodococcus sp. T2V TaxID=3034164 RepID=UPI0023E34930